MECTNEQIGTLISDYFSGHLSPAESEVVREHLAECQLCRESLQTMTILAPNGSAGQLSHPSKAVLAQYYHDRARMSPAISELITIHLATCNDCAAELNILDDMERELRGSVARQEQTGGRLHSLVGRYGRYLAYAAAACLLISVGYRVLVTEDRQGEQPQVYQLAQSTRAGGRVVEIHRERGQQASMLEVSFYHARDEYDYSATLIDGKGNQVGADVGQPSFPAPGRILIELRLADLSAGDYQLMITESRRDLTGQPSQTYYPFRLIDGN